MKTISNKPHVTKELLHSRLNYNADTGLFTWKIKEGSTRIIDAWNARYANKVAGSFDREGYVEIALRVNGKPTYHRAHRLAWLYMYGAHPNGIIDHIDRCKANNAIGNLRLSTHSENTINTGLRENNTSGVAGVAWHVRQYKWMARIKTNKKNRHLGSFRDKFEAICTRKSAEIKYWSDSQPPVFGEAE